MQNSKLQFKIQKLKNIFHLVEAILANIYYGFPSKKLKVIGVTGTDGKTTTTHLIYHILKSAGKRTSMISTVYGRVGEQEFDTGLHTTTPQSFLVQNLLRKSVDSGDEYFVLETTSHALDQNRVWGVNFEIGVLTNITHEHLDYHKSYEEYVKTKITLLKMAKIAVVNKDDQSYRDIKNQISNIKNTYKKSKIITYSLCHPELVSGSDFRKQMLKQVQHDITEFNQYNYLAAYSVCKQLGLSDKQILKAMKSFKLPPGRMELVYDGPFKVLIDFAHTPNAFEQVLPEIRKNYLETSGRLIHVFGAAGLRDASKRPLMGKASSRFADTIILTEEDYRIENPEEINKQIASGIANGRSYQVILDREEAIKKAVYQAKKNDVIVLTGKSHEKSLCRGKIEYPWDEFAVVKKYVNLRSGS